MKLMPQSSQRWCKLPTCGRRWETAYPGVMACPFCGLQVKDATDGWPHVCNRGHSASNGGECQQCAVEATEKRGKKRRDVAL